MFYEKEIRVCKPDFRGNLDIDLSIEISDFNGYPDCKIGHFGYNFWYRPARFSKLPIKCKPYKSNKIMERYVEKELKKNGWTIVGWITKWTTKEGVKV